MRRTVEVPGIVGNGNTVNQLVFPMGVDIIGLHALVDVGTVTAANITDTKVIANGETLQQMAGVYRDAINVFDRQQAFGGGDFYTPLEMRGMLSKDYQYATTLNTLSVDPLTKKAITSGRYEWTVAGATTPHFRFFAEIDDASAGGPGWIERIQQYVFDLSNAEVSLRTLLPFGTLDKRFWRRLFFDTATAQAITEARLLMGVQNMEVFKRTAVLNNVILTNGKRTPGADFEFSVDTTEEGIPEPFDTMLPDSDAKNPSGLMSNGNMDMRITGAAPDPGSTCVLSTLGLL